MSCHEVLLFGSFKDQLKKDRMTVELPAGATAGDVLKTVCGNNEDAAHWQRCMRVAVNCKYVSHDTVLQERDEVALIPPVAGG